jgi:hypothetical protein
MSRKRWRYPRQLRLALAEYCLGCCGCETTTAEIADFATSGGKQGKQRLDAAFAALLEEKQNE